jgi:hypothetical protein
MSDRAELLARQFEQAHRDLFTLAETLSDTQWLTFIPAEQCTVAALVRHIAVAYRFEIRAFGAVANGSPLTPLTRDVLAQSNAEAASTHANCDRAETLSLLRRNAAHTAAAVRAFTDDHLSRTGRYLDYLPALTLDQWLDRILVGHITSHLASIRSTLDPNPSQHKVTTDDSRLTPAK